MGTLALFRFALGMNERSIWHLFVGPVSRMRDLVSTGHPAESANVFVFAIHD